MSKSRPKANNHFQNLAKKVRNAAQLQPAAPFHAGSSQLTHFSELVALLGISVQNGVIVISEFSKGLKQRLSLEDTIVAAVRVRARPVVTTALMAMRGLFPAALSSDIGSESQKKPLAVVIIDGLVTATVLTLLIFPHMYWLVNRTRHGKNLADAM